MTFRARGAVGNVDETFSVVEDVNGEYDDGTVGVVVDVDVALRDEERPWLLLLLLFSLFWSFTWLKISDSSIVRRF
jgi:hypothetical protein